MWHCRQSMPAEAVDIQYRALGAVRIRSAVRSRTVAWENAKGVTIEEPTPAAVIRNSRREIIHSFRWYDNPLLSAMSIEAPSLHPFPGSRKPEGRRQKTEYRRQKAGNRIQKRCPKQKKIGPPHPDFCILSPVFCLLSSVLRKSGVFLGWSMIKSLGFVDMGLNSCDCWISSGFHS